jgi:ArsR family transcriptional regulator, arsenate/arsenite/antimonite-responsive transcriptional repressor
MKNPSIGKKVDTKRMAKILKALSHPNRLELYLEIMKRHEVDYDTQNECFIMDIVESLNIGAPTISHHLKELANADLITTERRGKYLVAKINMNTIAAVTSLLSPANRGD